MRVSIFQSQLLPGLQAFLQQCYDNSFNHMRRAQRVVVSYFVRCHNRLFSHSPLCTKYAWHTSLQGLCSHRPCGRVDHHCLLQTRVETLCVA